MGKCRGCRGRVVVLLFPSVRVSPLACMNDEAHDAGVTCSQCQKGRRCEQGCAPDPQPTEPHGKTCLGPCTVVPRDVNVYISTQQGS